MPNKYVERGRLLFDRARARAALLLARLRASVAGVPMERIKGLKPMRPKGLRPLKPLELKSFKSARPPRGPAGRRADLPLLVASGAFVIAAIAALISQHELSSLTQQVAELKTSIDRNAAIQAEGPFLAIPEQTWHGKPGTTFLSDGATAAPLPAVEPSAPVASLKPGTTKPLVSGTAAQAATGRTVAPAQQAVAEVPPVPAQRPKTVDTTATAAADTSVPAPKLPSEPGSQAAANTAPPADQPVTNSASAPATTGATASATSGEAAPLDAARECIPQGTAFIVGANDPYPVCGVAHKVGVKEVQDGRVLLANGTMIPAGGKGTLAGTNCLIELLAAAFGYAQLKVTCS